MVETAFSGIARLFPKHIHAVTAKGFKLKVALFACTPSFIVLTRVMEISCCRKAQEISIK